MAQLLKQEQLAQGSFEAGEISREAVAAARVERTAAALVQFGARAKWADALARLEGALQSPLDGPPPANPTPGGKKPKVPTP